MLTERTHYVRYVGDPEEQATWRDGSDPGPRLRAGAVYEVLSIHMSGWYTAVRLVDDPTASYNSVLFEDAGDASTQEKSMYDTEYDYKAQFDAIERRQTSPLPWRCWGCWLAGFGVATLAILGWLTLSRRQDNRRRPPRRPRPPPGPRRHASVSRWAPLLST